MKNYYELVIFTASLKEVKLNFKLSKKKKTNSTQIKRLIGWIHKNPAFLIDYFVNIARLAMKDVNVIIILKIINFLIENKKKNSADAFSLQIFFGYFSINQKNFIFPILFKGDIKLSLSTAKRNLLILSFN